MIKKCIMCGQEFEARGRQATCSATCSHARLRQLTNLRGARYKEQARQEAMRPVVLALVADYTKYGVEYVLRHYKLKYNTAMLDTADSDRYNKGNNTKQGTRHERD